MTKVQSLAYPVFNLPKQLLEFMTEKVAHSKASRARQAGFCLFIDRASYHLCCRPPAQLSTEIPTVLVNNFRRLRARCRPQARGSDCAAP
jgi:hypothetical protein